ncbi:MAG: hypothetical protein MJZ41_13130 [Bacteroidaceae bacterium]|nr:hypothetical protein [Bacteroidaceae bacterium]
MKPSQETTSGNQSNNTVNTDKSTKDNAALTDYEIYCQQQLDNMLDDMEDRCFGEMAEGQFVRSH